MRNSKISYPSDSKVSAWVDIEYPPTGCVTFQSFVPKCPRSYNRGSGYLPLAFSFNLH